MNDLFLIISIFALGAVAIVITLTATVLLLLKHISELENEVERTRPPF
jgi:hypothetical protein